MPVNDALLAEADEMIARLTRDLDDLQRQFIKRGQRIDDLRAALAARPQPLSPSTLEAAINCTEALADDRREPERYREWYAQAAAELRAVAGSAAPTDWEKEGRKAAAEGLTPDQAAERFGKLVARSATPTGDDDDCV